MADVQAAAPSAAVVRAAARRGPGGLGFGFWVGTAWLALVAFAAIFATVLPVQDPFKLDWTALASGPSSEHWLGTDALGRDIFARIVHGSRVTVIVGLSSVAVALVVGLGLGLLAGYYRGWVDAVVSWFVDVLLAFPALVLALCLAAFLGPNLRNVIIAIGVIAVPGFARMARASTIQVAEREYVLVARSLGARGPRLIFAEILPNVLQPVMTLAITVIGLVIIVEGALSFLGLGVPLPRPTWGGMINEARDQLTTNPVAVIAPSGVLLLTVLSLNVVAERLSTRLGWGQVRQ